MQSMLINSKKSERDKPSVCFVSPNLYPVLAPHAKLKFIGGAEVQQAIISKGLVRRGFQISAICGDFGQSDNCEIDGVTIYKTFKPRAGLPIFRFVHPRLTLTWKALKQADADIYYHRCAGMLTGIVAAFCKKYKKKIIFAGAHNTDFIPGRQLIQYSRDKKIYEYGLTHASLIIVQNEVQRELCLKNYGIKSIIIPNCYKTPEPKAHNKSKKILWVSTIKKWKRPELFIRIAKHLPEEKFIMIGGPSAEDGKKYFDQIKSACASVENLNFLGFLPYIEAEKYFNNAKLFINTSEYEGFPNTFLQAWARGIPTISFFDTNSRFNGMPVCITVKSVEEAVQRTNELLKDDNKRKQAGKLCLQHFKCSHSEQTILSRYEKVFTVTN